MRYFKLPLIITGMAFVVMIILGIGGMVLIGRSGGSDQDKVARSGMLGSGLALATSLVIGPFWILAAAKFGKDRRVALERQKSGSHSAAKLPKDLRNKKRKE